MTLLELLRQELPKRGGWPEGVRYITQDNGFSTYKGTICGYDSLPKFNGKIWLSDELCQYTIQLMNTDNIASDHATAIVTREQYEATGWDGTGLPPVGCPVEVNSPRHGWTQATVTAVTGTWIIAKCPDGAEYAGCHRCLNDDGSWTDNSGIFRPLRTEAERAIDEMVRLSGVSIGAAKILYDAGYRK